MSPAVYFELALTTAELGEKFLRSLTRVNADPYDIVLSDVCLNLADKYAEALDAQIAYLQNEFSYDIEETLKTVIEHRDRLDRDIESISAFGAVRLQAAA